MDDHTAISKSVVGDHYGQRLYDKWLMRGEACWFETVTCWCLFREFVCNIWKLWEPWVSLKTTKHNPIIIMASKPKTESACQFWNITSEEHQRPFDPFILHHSFAPGEISFLHSRHALFLVATRNKTIRSICAKFLLGNTKNKWNGNRYRNCWESKIMCMEMYKYKKCICFIFSAFVSCG